MNKKLEGRTTLISGGAGGIGFAIAKALGLKGMNIVIADIDASALREAAVELQNLNIDVLPLKLDVCQFDNWKSIVEQTIRKFGQLDMLVNNAGVSGVSQAIEHTDEAQWRWLIDVNLMGVVNGAKASIPAIKSGDQGGWIINVASMAGLRGMPYSSDYSATKAAVVALTECWRDELKSSGIDVFVLCPAFVQTRIHESNRVRQPQYASLNGPDDKEFSEQKEKHKAMVESGMSPDTLADFLVDSLDETEKYIVSHPEFKAQLFEKNTELGKSAANAERWFK